MHTQEREAREAGPPPHPAMVGKSHVAPRTLQLQELRGRELPKLVAWTVEEWRGVAEPPTPEECLYGRLNYRTAARTLFLRPYLAHFCSVFRRFFAVFAVLTPGFQELARKDRGPAA